jgi:hypothetical protein
MNATGLDVFESTLNKTHIWLNDLMVELGGRTGIRPTWRCASRCRRCATDSRWMR